MMLDASQYFSSEETLERDLQERGQAKRSQQTQQSFAPTRLDKRKGTGQTSFCIFLFFELAVSRHFLISPDL